VEALPRPHGYCFLLVVPKDITQQKLEEALKARWAELGLATDGVFKTGFCATVMTEHDMNSEAYVQTHAQVFVLAQKA
jgi:hypothetical protein